jgi:hypothetical protein
MVIMVAVALLLLLLVLVLTIVVIAGGGESVVVDVFGGELSTSISGVFLVGLVAGFIVALALWLLRVGVRKDWRQRKRMRDLRRRAGDGPSSETTDESLDDPDTTFEPPRSERS